MNTQNDELLANMLTRRQLLTQATLAGVTLTFAPLLLTTPAEAGLQFKRPSPGDQKKLGDQAAQDIFKKYKTVNDRRLTHFKEIGSRLVAALPDNDRKTWDFRFYVLESKEVNAFALPGGNMFMFTGLYKLLTTDDALAAVTGHEMTHVRKEHWAKAYEKEQQRNALIGIGAAIFRAPRAATTAAALAGSLIGLKYSRSEEDEADGGGLENLVAANYNPQGMIDLFNVLQKISGNGGGPSFLSDHPLTGDRIKHSQERISKLGDRKFPSVTPLDYSKLT